MRNHPILDPPSQSLWLGLSGGAPKLVKHLAPDRDWCHPIAWSADGSTVAFLIRDARLLLAHAVTGRVMLDEWLAGPQGGARAPRPSPSPLPHPPRRRSMAP